MDEPEIVTMKTPDANTTPRSRRFVVLAVAMLAALAVVGAGCTTVDEPRQTVALPCTYDEDGLMYDYRSGQCVRPTVQSFGRLWRFELLSSRAKKGNDPIDIDIGFRDPQTVSRVIALLHDFHVIRVKGLVLYVRDPSPTGTGWLSAYANLMDSQPSKAAFAEARSIILKGWADDYAKSGDPFDKSMHDTLAAGFATGIYLVTDISLKFKPSDAADFFAALEQEVETFKPSNPKDYELPSRPLPFPEAP